MSCAAIPMYQNYNAQPGFSFSRARKADARDISEFLKKIYGRAESVARKVGIDAGYAREVFRGAFDLSNLYETEDSYKIIDDVLRSDRSAAAFVAADYRSRSGGGGGLSKIAVFLGLAALVGGVAYASVASSQTNVTEDAPVWHVPTPKDSQPAPGDGSQAGDGSGTTPSSGHTGPSSYGDERKSESVRDRMDLSDDVSPRLIKVRPGDTSSSNYSGGGSSGGSSSSGGS